MYEARQQPDILKDLQTHSNIDASKFEGTFEYDVFASNSIEFAKHEVELEQLYKAMFADTSWGEYLTMRAGEAGVMRKNAVNAIGTVTVTGNGLVPIGSIFATTSGITYRTTQTVTIDGSGDIPIEAVDAGVGGNVAAGTITTIPMSIPGISKVTNNEPTHDGYNEEDDESLLQRYLTHVRTPGVSGNKYHYMEWATSVAGVGAAKIIPLWNGNGTVKVIVVDTDYKACSPELVEKVTEYIEDQRPIGATVTVVSAEPKVINISAKIQGKIDQEAFERNVREYFVALEKSVIDATTELSVSIAKIGALIFNDIGVLDYSDLMLNGAEDNIPLTYEEIATLGEVTFT